MHNIQVSDFVSPLSERTPSEAFFIRRYRIFACSASAFCAVKSDLRGDHTKMFLPDIFRIPVCEYCRKSGICIRQHRLFPQRICGFPRYNIMLKIQIVLLSLYASEAYFLNFAFTGSAGAVLCSEHSASARSAGCPITS